MFLSNCGSISHGFGAISTGSICYSRQQTQQTCTTGSCRFAHCVCVVAIEMNFGGLCSPQKLRYHGRRGVAFMYIKRQHARTEYDVDQLHILQQHCPSSRCECNLDSNLHYKKLIKFRVTGGIVWDLIPLNSS